MTPGFSDGSVDLSKVPSVQEIYETCYRYDLDAFGPGKAGWKGSRATAGGYFQNHHTTPKGWLKKLFPGRQFTAAELDSMPGVLVPKVDHNFTNLGGDENSFHNILKGLLPDGTSDSATILSALEKAYRQWDPELGPQIWQVTRQWLRQEGLL